LPKKIILNKRPHLTSPLGGRGIILIKYKLIMTEKKGEITDLIIRPFLNLIIILLILFLVWITWKYLNTEFEKKEKIRLEKIEKLRKIEEEKKRILKEKKDYKNYIKNIDLESDNSLTKFVNNKVHFDELWYIPEDLVSVWSKYVIDSKWWYIKVKKILKENLIKLSEQFYKDTKNNIVIVSWYRSYSYQKWIKDRGCPDNLCAKAGYSEHQSGLAIDIYSASSARNWANDNTLKKHFSWFKKNAHKYGFHNTYQKWLKIDGYEVEPWHWRYVWEKFARYLYENKITIAEFYYKEKIKG